MKKVYLIILMTVVTVHLHSQQYECNCDDTNDSYNEFLQNRLISRQYFNPIQHFRGSQYFNEWTPGNIIMEDGETVENMLLRYDMFMDELLWLRQTDFKIGIINKAVVARFNMWDRNGQLIGFFIKKRIKPLGMGAIDSYLQVLAEGNVSLYVFRNVVQAVSESRTVDNKMYFLEINENRYTVSLRRKNLLKTPGIDTELMRSIIRTNRLTFHNNEANFVKAVYLYNEAVM